MIKERKVFCDKCNKELGTLDETNFLYPEKDAMVILMGEFANTVECPDCQTKTKYIEE